ncbi:hypothetical protein B484DRAFT_454335 [Ochromonadaceae sp. CCMP2298]|nr:hypothetical protein B484DRAFT_454335 [Ochromonadaceae sp. CCMP2298]
MEAVPEEIDVCIVGSGVAGLSAALSLQRIGLSVRIFEKDFNFLDRRQGYGLTLTNTVKGPLSKLGVLEACIQKNCQSHCHYIFNPAGDVLGYYGRELKSSGSYPVDQGGNRGNLRIPRQDLRRMLIDQLEPGTILWGRTLQDYFESDQCVYVTLVRRDAGAGEDKTEAMSTFVLVGADGIRSVVRRLRDEKLGRTLLSPIHYLGISVIIGLSTATHPHIDSRGFYVLDGEHRMFTMPYRAPQPIAGVGDEQKDVDSPQLTMWQLSFSGLSEEQAQHMRRLSCTELLAEARRRTAGWLDPVSDMVLCTMPGEVWATGLYDRSSMPLFAKDGGSRVTVIGDACHPMAMFKGQGANQALMDGPLLAHWLGGGPGGAQKVGKGRGAKAGQTGQTGKGVSRKTERSVKEDVDGEADGDAVSQRPCLHGGVAAATYRASTSASASESAEFKQSAENAESTGSAEGAKGVCAQSQGVHVKAQSPSQPQSKSQAQSQETSASQALRKRQSVLTKLRCFERDMVARAASKQMASREAAAYLHSAAALEEVYGVAGTALPAAESAQLVKQLIAEKINAALGGELDRCMKSVVESFVPTANVAGHS